MGTPFLGEIKAVSFGFAPRGWAMCNGQLLPINQNQALFALLGTLYGGNGTTTFALPNLQGRVPIHVGIGFTTGQSDGETTHTLTLAELPAHNHLLGSVNQAVATTLAGNTFAAKPRRGVSRYTRPGSAIAINDGAATVGGSQPHENMQPYLALTFVIALQGIFPSRN